MIEIKKLKTDFDTGAGPSIIGLQDFVGPAISCFRLGETDSFKLVFDDFLKQNNISIDTPAGKALLLTALDHEYLPIVMTDTPGQTAYASTSINLIRYINTKSEVTVNQRDMINHVNQLAGKQLLDPKAFRDINEKDAIEILTEAATPTHIDTQSQTKENELEVIQEEAPHQPLLETIPTTDNQPPPPPTPPAQTVDTSAADNTVHHASPPNAPVGIMEPAVANIKGLKHFLILAVPCYKNGQTELFKNLCEKLLEDNEAISKAERQSCLIQAITTDYHLEVFTSTPGKTILASEPINLLQYIKCITTVTATQMEIIKYLHELVDAEPEKNSDAKPKEKLLDLDAFYYVTNEKHGIQSQQEASPAPIQPVLTNTQPQLPDPRTFAFPFPITSLPGGGFVVSFAAKNSPDDQPIEKSEAYRLDPLTFRRTTWYGAGVGLFLALSFLCVAYTMEDDTLREGFTRMFRHMSDDFHHTHGDSSMHTNVKLSARVCFFGVLSLGTAAVGGLIGSRVNKPST